MADYTTKHNPDPKWTPNLNALIEFMPDGFQAQAASSELTKLKALAALAEEVASPSLRDPNDPDWLKRWYERYDAITKDGGK